MSDAGKRLGKAASRKRTSASIHSDHKWQPAVLVQQRDLRAILGVIANVRKYIEQIKDASHIGAEQVAVVLNTILDGTGKERKR